MSRRPRAWTLLALALLALTLALLAPFTCTSRQLADPPWTDEALPPIPPPADNGWERLMQRDSFVSIEGDVSFDGLLQREDTSDAERWQLVVAEGSEIRSAVSNNAEVLELWHEATSQPVFADGCTISTLERGCKYLQGVQIHQLALDEVLDDALSEDWPSANDNLTSSLEADLALLQTTRSLLGTSAAVTMATSSMSTAYAVLGQQEPAEADAPARDRLLHAVAAFEAVQPAEVLRRTIIGEYRRQRADIEAALGAEPSTDRLPFVPGFDAEKTSAVQAQLFRELLALAEGQPVDDPVQWTWTDHVYNRVGVAVVGLDVQREFLGGNVERIQNNLDQLQQWRQRIQERWPLPR